MGYWVCLMPALMLVCVVVYLRFKYKDFPPGPYGLPLIGYQPFLGKNPIDTFANLSKRYGKIVSVNVGMNNVVFVNDWKAIKEGFIRQGAVTSGRPHLFLEHKIFTDKDIIFGEGLKWKAQRNFTLNVLRDFGFGRSSLESVIMYEVDKLTEYLNEHAGERIDISKLFVLPLLNIIWNIAAGKRIEDARQFLIDFKEFCQTTITVSSFEVLNQLPFLRHLLPGVRKSLETSERAIEKMKVYFEHEIVEHERNFQENNLNDFIDMYLAEIFKRRDKDPNGKDIPPFDREHLSQTLLDIVLGSEDTTDTTMNWVLLHMATNPRVQQKVQEELDAVIAKDSFLSLSSKSLAPYTEATLLEIQRHPTTVPLSVPHVTTRNMELFDYKIPKGTTIYPNLYAVHHDQEYWGDPDVFRPERFLAEDGKTVLRHECFVPFSIGPRACLGESMAKLELHLLFTTLLRRFTFETVPGEPKLSTEFIAGSMFRPHPYFLIIKPR